MGQYEIYTFIVCVTALASYFNHRFFRLSPTIGIMAVSLILSLAVMAGQSLFPHTYQSLTAVIAAIDFHGLLMECLLGFLLFAGSMHIDAGRLRAERLPILVLATVGIIISTAVIGSLLYFVFIGLHMHIGFLYCLMFAALISPTDPIASLAILKRAGLSKSLELKIAGESLFNDGMAVVVFLTILSVAQTGLANFSPAGAALLFFRQAAGGLLYGWALGMACYAAIRSIDKYEVEVMITIATVMGGYLLAEKLHVSGPLAMVVAGIIIGNKSRGEGVSDITRDYMEKFWELIDELLNAMLFMLIGFEMLVVRLNMNIAIAGLATIAIVLLARWVSVTIPVLFLRSHAQFEKHTITILTWGGLRGGLSVALALSLPQHMHRDEFVAITYMVVVFSILVQGLTIGRLYKKLNKQP